MQNSRSRAIVSPTNALEDEELARLAGEACGENLRLVGLNHDSLRSYA
jgi:hypothetical protein